MKPFFGLLLLLLAVLGFGQTNPLNVIQWNVVKTGQFSAIKEPSTQVFKTEGQFQTYWRANEPRAPFPAGIDWANELVIAINLGEKPSAAYSVFIKSMDRDRRLDINVTYVEKKMGGEAASVMTSPYIVARVKRTPGSFNFTKTTYNDPSTGGGGGGQCTWRTYCSEVTGGGSARFERVIENESQFRDYWRSVFNEDAPTKDIDWDSECLVAIHLGNMPSTGYDVLVESLRQTPNGLCLTYVIKSPSGGQKVKKSQTSPFTLVRLPKFSGRMEINHRTWNSEG